MFIKTFVADSMDDAFKQIKREMGPDAIILKSVTNKGIKGKLKRNKYEVTAGITEREYIKKARVDSVLGPEQKEKFYSDNSSNIAHMIDQYDEHLPHEVSMNTQAKKSAGGQNNGYGKLALNKVPKQKNQMSLDEFIRDDEEEQIELQKELQKEKHRERQKEKEKEKEKDRESERERDREYRNEMPAYRPDTVSIPRSAVSYSERERENDPQFAREISVLEKRVSKIESWEGEISKIVQTQLEANKIHTSYLNQFSSFLHSLGLDYQYVKKIIRKVAFEVTEEMYTDIDYLIDFTMKDMADSFEVKLPVYSGSSLHDTPTINVLISESVCGQTSLVFKQIELVNNPVIIVFDPHKKSPTTQATLTEIPNQFEQISKVFGKEYHQIGSMTELVSLCKKLGYEKKNIFIDIKNRKGDFEEIKKIILSLKVCFDNLEISLTLSAINSDQYNQAMMIKYKDIVDALNVTHLDHCLNYLTIFNYSYFSKKPVMFFSTGEKIPHDLEPASIERVLSKVFTS